jgi:hypothetical protein
MDRVRHPRNNRISRDRLLSVRFKKTILSQRDAHQNRCRYGFARQIHSLSERFQHCDSTDGTMYNLQDSSSEEAVSMLLSIQSKVDEVMRKRRFNAYYRHLQDL